MKRMSIFRYRSMLWAYSCMTGRSDRTRDEFQRWTEGLKNMRGYSDCRRPKALTITLTVDDGQHHNVYRRRTLARGDDKGSQRNSQFRTAPTTVPILSMNDRLSPSNEDRLTSHLHEESDPGCKLHVLTKLQILKKGNSLYHRVLTVKSAVHVGNRFSGEDVR